MLLIIWPNQIQFLFIRKEKYSHKSIKCVLISAQRMGVFSWYGLNTGGCRILRNLRYVFKFKPQCKTDVEVGIFTVLIIPSRTISCRKFFIYLGNEVYFFKKILWFKCTCRVLSYFTAHLLRISLKLRN